MLDSLPPWMFVLLSVVYVVGILILMLIMLYTNKDLLCRRFRPRTIEHSADDPHYSGGRHLTGITYNERGATGTQGAAGSQLPGRLFTLGKPSDYHLSEAQLRLPSYESVRKQDLQRQMNTMIAQHFGVSGGHDEPPPMYDETSRQSLDISPVGQHSLDALTQDRIPHFGEDTQSCHEPTTGSQAPVPSYSLPQNPKFLPV